MVFVYVRALIQIIIGVMFYMYLLLSLLKSSMKYSIKLNSLLLKQTFSNFTESKGNPLNECIIFIRIETS